MACIRKTLLATAVMALFSASSNAKTPIDLGVINEEKIIEMLEAFLMKFFSRRTEACS